MPTNAMQLAADGQTANAAVCVAQLDGSADLIWKSEGMQWIELLLFSSAAGALTCTKLSARHGRPYRTAIDGFLHA